MHGMRVSRRQGSFCLEMQRCWLGLGDGVWCLIMRRVLGDIPVLDGMLGGSSVVQMEITGALTSMVVDDLSHQRL